MNEEFKRKERNEREEEQSKLMAMTGEKNKERASKVNDIKEII